MAKRAENFLVCLDNKGYEASLEPRKLYRTLPDPKANEAGYVRIVDESGEDYLYAAKRFAPVQLPLATRRALAHAS